MQTSSKQANELALRIWAALGKIFGKAMFREHGDKPNDIWRKQIVRMSEAELSKGLRNLINDRRAFPPNLTDFIEACTRKEPAKALGMSKLNEPRLVHSTPESRRAAIVSRIEALRHNPARVLELTEQLENME